MGRTLTRGISLRRLLPDAVFHGTDDVCVTSCCCEASECRPGDLFVNLSLDGPAALPVAVARGAKFLLSDRPWPALRLPACVVPNPRAAFGRLCQALAGDPSRQLKVIGVAGPQRATTGRLIASVLDAGGYDTARIPEEIQSNSPQAGLSLGDDASSPLLATRLAEAHADGNSHVVLEVSSRALQLECVSGIELDIACVAARSERQHNHHSAQLQNADAARFIELLAPEGVAVLNADNRAGAGDLAPEGCLQLTVGIDQPAEFMATIIERASSEQVLLLSVGHDTIPLRTMFVETQDIYACLLATAIGFAYGIELTTIVRGLEAVGPSFGSIASAKRGRTLEYRPALGAAV